jgi:hypothetical protein
MHMRINYRGHDSHSRQIYTVSTCWYRYLTCRSDSDKTIDIDSKGSVLNRRPITRN